MIMTNDEIFVLPRSTRLKDHDFAICRKIDFPTGESCRVSHPGCYNTPTTRSGEVCIDGQWWAYRGADAICSDDEIAYAIRHHVVAFTPDYEARIVGGKRVGVPLCSLDEFQLGISDDTPRPYTLCERGHQEHISWCDACQAAS
jgi:hypothetical protein